MSSTVRTPRSGGGALDRSHEARPLLSRRATDLVRPRPHLAVVAILIALEPAIEAHDIAPSPAFRSRRGPRVEVARHAAQRPQAHNARTAAHDARLRERPCRAAGRPRAFETGPKIVLVQRRAWKRVGDIRRNGVRRRVDARLRQAARESPDPPTSATPVSRRRCRRRRSDSPDGSCSSNPANALRRDVLGSLSVAVFLAITLQPTLAPRAPC